MKIQSNIKKILSKEKPKTTSAVNHELRLKYDTEVQWIVVRRVLERMVETRLAKKVRIEDYNRTYTGYLKV